MAKTETPRSVEACSLWATPRRGWAYLLFMALGVAMFMAGAAAAPDQIRTTTYDGIPLDEPIHIRFGGTLLRIPAGYLAPWPRLSHRNRVNETNRIAINFWMPSRRYLEIHDSSLAGSRPSESGRALPSPDVYVVQAHSVQRLSPDELDYRSPERGFRNLTSHPGPSSFSFEAENFGLLRFWRNDWPHAQPQPFLNYRHLDGSDPQILLRCTPPERASPNPICDGQGYFVAEQLSFYIVFPRLHVSRWRENVDAVRDLLNSWKAAP